MFSLLARSLSLRGRCAVSDEKRCPVCLGEIEAGRGRPRKYCSAECLSRSRSNCNDQRPCAHCGVNPARKGGFCSTECHGAATIVGFERPAQIEAAFQAARKVIRFERSRGAYDDTLDRYVRSRTSDPCVEVA